MATEELRVQLTADDDASKVIDKVATKAEDLEGEQVKVKVGADTKTAERDIAGLLSKVDKLSGDAANLLLTTNATQIAREITDLVTDLDKLDASDPQVDITVANIGQLQGDLDQVAAKAKEINDTPIRIDTGPSVDGMNRLRDSSDQSRSVMANLSGNVAQDLGQIGGVAGSAGVAIGQLAEYATEGNISLRNLAQVAGPMAGLTAGALALQYALGQISKANAFDKAQVDAFAESIRKGEDAAEGLIDRLIEAGKVDFEGPGTFFSDAIDAAPALDRAGVSAGRFVEAVLAGEPGLQALGAEMRRNNVTTEDRNTILVAAANHAKNYQEALTATEIAERLFGSAEADRAAEQEAASQATEEAARRVEILGDVYKRSLTAAREFSDAVASVDWQQAEIEGAVAGAQRFAEAQFGLADIASQTEAAYDDLNAAIEENGFTFDLNTEKGRANQDQLQSLYSSVIPSMASAYDAADGSQAAFAAGMDKIAWDVMAGLTENTKLSAEEIGELMTRMGLLPGNVQTQFELLGEEDARIKLGLLQGAMESLPPDIQRQVQLAIIHDDPQLALEIISSAITGTPMPPVPVTADTGPAVGAVEGFAGASYDPATVGIEGDPSAADSTVDDLVAGTEARRPVIPVNATNNLALAMIIQIIIAAALARPEVIVTANASSAIGTINAVGGMRPQVPVNAYLSDYPSAAEIARAIGTVRVAVVAEAPRLTGARP